MTAVVLGVCVLSLTHSLLVRTWYVFILKLASYRHVGWAFHRHFRGAARCRVADGRCRWPDLGSKLLLLLLLAAADVLMPMAI